MRSPSILVAAAFAALLAACASDAASPSPGDAAGGETGTSPAAPGDSDGLPDDANANDEGIAEGRVIGTGGGLTLVPGGVVLAAWVNDSELGLVRFDEDGALVTAFGSQGGVRFPRSGDQAPIVNAVRYDPAGRVVVVSTMVDTPSGIQPKRFIDRVWL